MFLRNGKRISLSRMLLVFFDFLIVWISVWLAFYLRHEPFRQQEVLSELGAMRLTYFLLGISVSAVLIYYLSGFYRHIWRYASIMQYLTLFLGTAIQTAIFTLAGGLMFWHVEWAIYIIYWMLTFILTSGVRVAYRVIANHHAVDWLFSFRRIFTWRRHLSDSHIRTLIFGAGHAASQLIREMMEVDTGYRPVAIIDDNPDKRDMQFLGIPVVGNRFSIARAVAEYNIQEIILAVPSANREDYRAIVELCTQTGCKLKTLPSIHQMISDKVAVRDIKDVAIEDLLGRDEINTLSEIDAAYLKNEVVLVTGGGGSIGSELCRQIARLSPKRLIVFDIYENNAYHLQQELETLYGPNLDLVLLIGSVRDRTRLEKIFAEYRPNIVFHAAAHKHVPLMENSPGEAVKNNIFGTYNVAAVAGEFGVRRVVLISTDKAVNPTNVMGATKRIAEMIFQTMCQLFPETSYSAVRFGNVLGSNGSVIPLFKQQIRDERRIKVTHPDITRYFMTIPEAARLVIQAGSLNGIEPVTHVYVLDMGKPVKILDLARDLIRLSGFEPDKDIPIEFTGLRPGEKMYEELYYDLENTELTANNKIFLIKPNCDIELWRNELTILRRLIGWDNEDFQALTAWILKVQSRLTPDCTSIPEDTDKIHDVLTIKDDPENDYSINDSSMSLRLIPLTGKLAGKA